MNRPRHSLIRLAVGLSVIAALFLLRALPASAAGSCAQDLFTAAGNSQTLGCTANDISLTGASNPRDPATGGPLSQCVPGQPFNVIVDFTVQSTSNKTRSNVGLYLGTIPVGQAGSSALTGTCDDNILSQLHLKGGSTSCAADSTGCLGDANYDEEDGTAADNCGDAAAASLHTVTVELDGVTCPNVGATAVILPDCTTWQVPGKTITCFSDPNQGWPFVPTAAIPGTTSKCNCGQVSIPITPINPTISATKTPNPATVTEPSGKSTYTVVVKNTTAAAVDVTINQLCDDKFGNIATATTSPAQNPCAAGSLCSAPNNVAGSTCATNITCPLPATLAQNGTVTCTFDGTITGTEPGSVKDTVTANGVGSGIAVSAQASATVTIGEAAAKAQVLKSLDTGEACAVARYKLEVDNISTAGTDESETLTGLMDSKFGADLTTLGASTANPKVVGTTCGVASGSFGLGTMASGQPGALQATATGGTLPASIAVGGSYTCEFDGEFCAALSSFNGCSTALEDTNLVTAKLSLDGDGVCAGGTNDGNLCTSDAGCPGTGATCVLTLTPTATLTVDSCFSHTP